MNKVEIDITIFSDVIKAYGVSDDNNPFIIPIESLEIRELIVHSDWQFGYKANKNSIVEAEYAAYGVTSNHKIFSLTGVA